MLAKKYDKVKHVYLDLKKNQVLLRIRLIEFMLLSDYKDDNWFWLLVGLIVLIKKIQQIWCGL